MNITQTKRRVAVIGGSGFIGYHLAMYLSDIFDVKVLDVVEPERGGKRIDYVDCDIRDCDRLEKSLEDVDLVVHSAIVQIPLINQQKRLGYEVNVVGTQNICEIVSRNSRIKGMILVGTWHTIGEKGIKGTVDERFGFRPDKVEERARFYALSKVSQESIVRLYDEITPKKVFGIIRIGTALGLDMPEETAANIFIKRGLEGGTITPYRHSLHRPMLYIDIKDVCRGFQQFALKVLNECFEEKNNSLEHIINLYHPKPMTILELAKNVQKAIAKQTRNTIVPKIEIIDKGEPAPSREDYTGRIKVDISKAQKILCLKRLRDPKRSIENIVKYKTSHQKAKT